MLELIVYMISMAITPGPNTIASLANASAVGIRKGIYLNYGMLVGITLISSLCFLFLSIVGSLMPQVIPILQFLGSIYICYLAIHYLKKGTIVYSETAKGGFITGFLMQLYNFKVLLLCITAISTYILPISKGVFISYLISLLIPLCCFICGLVWSIAGELISSLYERHNKAIRYSLSAILFILALVNFYQLFSSIK